MVKNAPLMWRSFQPLIPKNIKYLISNGQSNRKNPKIKVKYISQKRRRNEKINCKNSPIFLI